MPKYFGTDGVRGTVGNYPVTPDFALRLGYAAGKVLSRISDGGKLAVIIGKDTRLSGYLFESSLEAGFSYAGIDVYMIGPIPTPAVAYLVSALNLCAGVVISASHNPYMDNGIKFFSANGTKLADEIELAIEDELDKPMKMATSLGRVMRLEDAKGRYIEFCKSTFPRTISLKGITIVVDCANGATYQVAPNVFAELGATVIKRGCEPDGLNINAKCGSLNPQGLVEAVKGCNADFGIAFDGDGDRVLFVDDLGQVYNGDKLLYIIMLAYKATNRKLSGIVGTIMTNLAMEHQLQQMGIGFVRAKVGDRYVLEEIKKRGWLLGGEPSGHILCLDKHTTGDGIISALQVLFATMTLSKSLAELVTWSDYPQITINVPLNGHVNNWQERIDNVVTQAQLHLKNRGRLVVRPSGTEPLVRVMMEDKDAEFAKNWAEKIANAISR